MDYNQDTPHPRGVSSIRKRVNPLKQTFQVTGMTCSACSAHVEKAVNKLEAVAKAEVSLMTNSMSVEYKRRRDQPPGHHPRRWSRRLRGLPPPEGQSRPPS